MLLELRRLPREHDPVYAGEQAEGVPLIDPVALVTAQRRADRPAALRVGSHPLQKGRVEGRAHTARDIDVPVELGD